MQDPMRSENLKNSEVDTLIENNLRLVLKIANDFLNLGLPWEDLVSEGNRGLVVAASHFDPERGTKFGAYSAWWIRQAIRQAISEQSNVVRIPIGTQISWRKVRRTVTNLTNSLGRSPSDKEVAQATNLSVVTVHRLRNLAPIDTLPLNAPVLDEDSDSNEFQDFLTGDSESTPDQILIEIEEIDGLFEVLSRLTEREQKVLRFRFGLDGNPIRTLEEVGAEINCTSERVRQIQNRALLKLHTMLKENR